MSKATFQSFLQKLSDPDAASSVGPLIIVVGVLAVICLSALFILVRAFRSKQGEKKARGGLLYIVLNRNPKFRFFLQRVLIGNEEEQYRALLTEMEGLRAQIDRLERENGTLREGHTKTIRQNTELKDENIVLSEKAEECQKGMERAEQLRSKAQNRAEDLEQQVAKIYNDIERLCRLDADASEFAKIRNRLAGTDKSAPAEVDTSKAKVILDQQRLISHQQAEIEKMKGLLMICKKQITEILGRQNPTPQASSPPSQAA